MKNFPFRRASVIAAIAASAFTSFAAHAASLDLSTYSVKFTSSLVPPPGGGFAEASGIAYNPERNSLLVVGDEATAHEFRLDGTSYPNVLRYSGISSFQDPEGITYIGNGEFVLAEERFMRMWLVKPTLAEVQHDGELWTLGQKSSGKSYSISPFNVGNIGLEGIAYDPLTGGYFGVKQDGPQAVYFVNVDMQNPTGGSHMELFDPALLGLTTLSDIAVLSTVDAFKGADFADNLLILSATSQKLIEVTRDGQVLSSFDLSNILSPTGARIQTIEGVVLDKSGNIYLAAELGGVQGSALIALAPVPEPEAWAMLIGGLALIGNALRRRQRVA